jgi:uncharacterized protein (TIGR02270 family)
MTKSLPVIPHIIDQHAEEAAFLWLLRDRAVSAPHYSLKDLAKLDDRVEAHIDGLRIAGDYGWEVVKNNLAAKESGEVFVAGVLALEEDQIEMLNLVYKTVEESPETVRGLISAFGWVEPQHLRGKVNGLLVSQNPFWREVGLAACAVHRVDSGKFLEQCLSDDNLQLRARAARAAGELGRVDLKPVLLDQVDHQDPDLGFWSAWSAVLMGDRGKALNSLHAGIIDGAGFSLPALQVVLRVLDPNQIKELLTVPATHNDRIREAVMGAGITGDPAYIPWLIKQMEVPKLAKVAGESFSFITGVDIAYNDLEGELPKDFATGPTEDPENENVAMDPDEDLPVPDPALVERWWQQHQPRFQNHVRYLLGHPINQVHCQEVLKTGKQRQRQAAALELSLQRPTAPLFETRANGKKQLKWLAS